MSKILCFIYDNMADFELTFSTHVLGTCAQQEIVPIAYSRDTVRSHPGVLYTPAATVREALDFEDVSALIVPGGWNSEQREEITELIQKLNNEGKIIAAICAGSQYLARAGILNGRNYTTTLTKEYMEQQKIEDPFPRDTFIDESIVADGNIITAVGAAFIKFGIEIADSLNLFDSPEQKKEFHKAYVEQQM
jgi:putative intracellular protease/amidase